MEARVSNEPQTAAIRSALAEWRKVGEYLADPRFEPIARYFQGVVAPYEQTLHNVNVEERTRDRACYVVDALTKCLRIREYVQMKVQALESQLAKAEGVKEPEKPWSRILTFMR